MAVTDLLMALPDLTGLDPRADGLLSRQPRGPRLCELDRIPLRVHPRCRRCRILVGPEHYRQDLIDGLCESCYMDVRRRALRRNGG